MVRSSLSTAYTKARGQASYVHREVAAYVSLHRATPTIIPIPDYIGRPITLTPRRTLKSVKRTKKPVPSVGAAVSSRHRRRKLALLLPGHNEELILATTIRSAIAAGQQKRDIFVVDDASTDATRQIACQLLGKQNVLTVKRSGKALAVKKAFLKFEIERNYQWLHVADADSIFSPDYFRIYRRKLDPKKYAVAVGFVQSLRGNWISTYRALTYTFSQHVYRRVQSWLGMISVFPGPITCFRTDILSQLDFEAKSLTEDFDITLQVHRKRLGKILFIPKAVNYTQDPQTLRDFCKQTQRWQRGFFQGVKKYHIGIQGQRIDISLGFQMLQAVLFLVQVCVLFPLVIRETHSWLIIPVAFAADFILNSLIAIWAMIIIRRWNILGALPYFYFLRWLEIGIFLWAFVEIMILRRFQVEVRGWATEGRRYKLNSAALQDVAK
jgi:cellulose synthase/poly-beta-1,6-N-acetylglucosamine synthase-like glycosyltransferase